MVRIFKCKHCGNLMMVMEKKGCTPVCCGEEMVELIAGTVDAAKEKHIPVIVVNGKVVEVVVGEVLHPMTEAHLISWIILETNKGVQVRNLQYTDEPKAIFALADGEEVVRAFEYCNLHGLWMKEM